MKIGHGLAALPAMPFGAPHLILGLSFAIGACSGVALSATSAGADSVDASSAFAGDAATESSATALGIKQEEQFANQIPQLALSLIGH